LPLPKLHMTTPKTPLRNAYFPHNTSLIPYCMYVFVAPRGTFITIYLTSVLTSISELKSYSLSVITDFSIRLSSVYNKIQSPAPWDTTPYSNVWHHVHSSEWKRFLKLLSQPMRRKMDRRFLI